MNKHGQALMIFLFFIALLSFVSVCLYGFAHKSLMLNRLTNYCQKKVLDITAIQGQGLAVLGKLNPTAKTIIDTRREVDKALLMPWPPPVLAALQSLQQSLIQAQKVVAGIQKTVIASTVQSASALTLKKSKRYQYVTEKPLPFLPGGSHGSTKAINLHVIPLENYSHETGHPLRLDGDFSKNQKSRLELQVQTSQFLKPSLLRNDSDFLDIKCQAHVFMKSLSSRWHSQLTEVL